MMTFHKSLSMTPLLFAFGMCTSPGFAAPQIDGNATCKVRNADATMLTAFPAEWPPIALQESVSGSALVRIDVQRNGTARKATIVVSTGNAALDEAAQSATLQQKYSPEVRDCANVGGSYIVEVDFKR